MKKSLIALAALAASGFAMAQSSVTLFGTVDTGVAVIDGATTVTGMSNSGTSSSALGFRGVEDLGNGLKAGFHLEAGINTDNGDGAAGGATGSGLEFARRSTISLMGGFGELRLGRDLTAAYSAVSRFDPFGTVGVGSTRLWSGAAAAPSPLLNAGFNNVRRSNMLAYYSPSFGGFKVNVNYALGERVEASNNGVRSGDTAGVAALYDNGPLSLSASYQQTGRSAVNAVTPATAEEQYWALGAAYDFGVVKLSAAYTNIQDKSVANETFYNREGDNYLIGLAVPVGAAGVVKASYNRYEAQVGTAAKDKADHYSLGYVHNLSKRTAVYGTYSYLKNKNNGSVFTLNNAGFTVPALDNSGKIQALQLGVRHSF